MEPTNDAEIRATIARFMGNERDYPNYLKDLNACHEVEAELERLGLHLRYLPTLFREVRKVEGDKVIVTRWAHTHATAEQRARAAYAIIKAQKEAGND